MLRQRDYSNISSYSLLTMSEVAEYWGCSRITAHNICGSGEFHSFTLRGTNPDPHQWKKIPLDMTIAYLEFTGGQGNGQPHGLKKGRDPADFLHLFEEAKRRGGHAYQMDGKWYWLDRGDGQDAPVYREFVDD